MAQKVEELTVDAFVKEYVESGWLFRGQGGDRQTILPGLYRDLWPLRTALPFYNDLAQSFRAKSPLTVTSMKVAKALVSWMVRNQRFVRFSTTISDLLKYFYPEDHSSDLRRRRRGENTHLWAVQQHAGYYTNLVDWTWSPIIACWFACHELVTGIWQLRANSASPIVYVLDPTRVHERVQDLRFLPKAFPRPHRQMGVTIATGWLEDLRPFVDKVVQIRVPATDIPFDKAGISASHLFPDAEDPIHDAYLFFCKYDGGFPWLVDWAIENPTSPLGRLYRTHRETVIRQMSLVYDAFHVRAEDGLPIVADWRAFDRKKNDGLDPCEDQWELRPVEPKFTNNGWGSLEAEGLGPEELEQRCVGSIVGANEYTSTMATIDWARALWSI